MHLLTRPPHSDDGVSKDKQHQRAMATGMDPQEPQKELSVAETETSAPTVAPASAVAEPAPSSATNGDDAASSSMPKPASTPWSDVKVFRPPNTAGPSSEFSIILL